MFKPLKLRPDPVYCHRIFVSLRVFDRLRAGAPPGNLSAPINAG